MSTCLQEIWSLDGLQEIWSLAGAAARASGAPDDRGVFKYHITPPKIISRTSGGRGTACITTLLMWMGGVWVDNLILKTKTSH